MDNVVFICLIILRDEKYIVPVGLFDIDDNLFLEHQIFTEKKPEYYSFSQKTKNMTGAEVFAEFLEKLIIDELFKPEHLILLSRLSVGSKSL